MILKTLATKESKINFIKAITVLIMNSAIYFSIVLIYSALIWSVFGLEGWNMKNSDFLPILAIPFKYQLFSSIYG